MNDYLCAAFWMLAKLAVGIVVSIGLLTALAYGINHLGPVFNQQTWDSIGISLLVILMVGGVLVVGIGTYLETLDNCRGKK